MIGFANSELIKFRQFWELELALLVPNVAFCLILSILINPKLFKVVLRA